MRYLQRFTERDAPMPETSKQQMTKEKIQRAAKVVFLKKGYADASMREIAQSSGVSPAAIYRYFPGKKELFDSLAIDEMENARPEYERRQMEICTAAMILFGKHGFDKTSMDDIAAAAGISKPTLYQYFENKESLFTVSLQTAPVAFAAKSLLTLPMGTDLRNAIWDLGINFGKNFEQPFRRALLKTIINDSERFPEIGKSFFALGVYQVYDIFTNLIKERISCDAITVSKSRKAFMVFMGSLQAYIILYRITAGAENPPDWNEYLSMSVNVFCNYMNNLGITSL